MPRRAVPLLLLALALAGCSTPPAPPEAEPTPHLLALDGRRDYDRARGEALLAKAGLGPVQGAAWFGGGILHAPDPLAADYAALEPAALAWLAPGVPQPAPGAVVVSAPYAERHGLEPGERVELRAWRWPPPLVATSFEMERTRPCDPDRPARLCFSATLDDTETELHLAVDEGSQDLAFLPDMAELGGAAPAWWNGTFTGPRGEESPFQALVDAQGNPSSGERNGTMDAGTWVIRYHLETLRGRMPAGLAGIVRLREPGYHWFDDRLQGHDTPEAQARAVLATAEPVRLDLVVHAAAELPRALSGFDLLLAPEDAQRLEGRGAHRVGALLLNATPDQGALLQPHREVAPDLTTIALDLRALAPPPPAPEPTRAILFRAPPDVDAAALPPVEGAAAPRLALALRPGVGANVSIDGRNLTTGAIILAPAGPAGTPPPWTMPTPARWATPREALENLSRSRTLLLASDDLATRDVAVARLLIGTEGAGRVAVVVGVVEGGPHGVLWASAPLAVGAGEPEARVVLPLAPGADPATVAERARAAWAPYGVAPEPSRKP